MNEFTQTRVLAFCLQQIPSATLGVIKILEYLQKNDMLEFKFKTTVEVTAEDIAWADIVIPIRSCEEIEKIIISEAKKAGRYLIYFLDDDLLNIPSDSLSAGYFNQATIRDNIQANITMCNMLWTTNKNIKNKYSEYIDIGVVINVPVEKDEVYLINKLTSETNDFRKVKIGFAGSKDHGAFVQSILSDVIQELLRDYGDSIEVEFFGCKPKFLESNKDIIYIPYVNNYSDYKQIIRDRKWDIGLAPLKDTAFHRCKYFNKYIEYSSLGISGVYSNVEPFNFIVKNYYNGIVVENTPHAWKEAILELVTNNVLRRQIVIDSQSQLREQFDIERIARELISNIPYIINYKAESYPVKKIVIKKIPKNYLIYKMFNIIKVYKMNAPVVLANKLLQKLKNK